MTCQSDRELVFRRIVQYALGLGLWVWLGQCWWGLIDLLNETVCLFVVLMHLSFIIMTVAFSLQVLRTDTHSCRVRAENLNFRSDIGAETFYDAYINESQTIMG